jgi:hypothetical protein
MKTLTLAPLKKLSFIAVALLGLTVSSCKKEDGGYDFDGTVVANVQLYNASPDAGPVSMYVHEILRTPSPVNFGTTSGYNKTYTGSDAIDIRQASGQSIANTSMQLNADYSYSYYLVGQSGAYSILTSNDTQPAPATGKVKVRFINAINGPSAADVAVGATSYSSVGAKGMSDFKEIASGSTVVRVAYTSGNTSTVLTQTVNLESGKIYTVVAKGVAGTTGTNAPGMTLVENNLSPRIF